MNSLSLSFETNDSRPVSGVRLLPLTTTNRCSPLGRSGGSPRQEPAESVTFPALSGRSEKLYSYIGTTLPASMLCSASVVTGVERGCANFESIRVLYFGALVAVPVCFDVVTN